MLNRPMVRLVVFTLVLVTACSGTLLRAQEAVPEEQAGDTKSISVGFSMENLSAGELEAKAGVLLEDFLNLGVLWGLGFETLESTPANNLSVGIWCEASLLKENQLIPISVDLSASFDKSRTVGAYLRDNNRMMSGTGYTVGLCVSKSFTLSETWSMETALKARDDFTTVTTEAIPGSGSTFETVIESTADYIYGIEGSGAVILNESIGMRFGAFLFLNSSFTFLYGPVISLITK